MCRMWSLQPHWLVVAALVIALATANDDVTTDAPVVATEEPRTIMNVQVADRQVSSIAVTWDAPEDTAVVGFKIRTQKSDSEDMIFSPELSTAENEYLVENLMAQSDYKICVLGNVNGKDALEDCRDASTIPLVRLDSVLGLIGVLGYIMMMILIGIFCWYCAKKRAQADEEEEEDEDGEPEKIEPAIYTPAYVSPPTAAPMRSSIEDNPDIPYITPPVDQLNKTNLKV